jgi:hypothetical protein
MRAVFDRVVQADRNGLAAWLLSAEADDADLDFQEWLGIVELYTHLLTWEYSEVGADEWGRLSDAYDRALSLAMRTGAFDETWRAAGWMNLSSVLMRRVGPRDDVELMSIRRMLDEFFAALPVDYPTASAAADTLRRRPDGDTLRSMGVEKLLPLRQAKTLTRPLTYVLDLIHDERRPQVEAWASIIDALP